MTTSNKVLLFDLGNVLLPIDLDLTYKAFADYSTKYSFEEIKRITHELALWMPYESGQQSDAEFRTFLRKELSLHCTDQEFDKAFNALLLQFPSEVYALLQTWKNQFAGLYLLSNTSNIHAIDYFQYTVGDEGVSIFPLFDQLFLSFEMGLVKPDAAIYQKVSDTINCPFDQIIFFDDNQFNIESAVRLGLDAHLIQPNRSLKQINQTLRAYVNE